MNELCLVYQEQLSTGTISQKTLNWRLRGVYILNELFMSSCFQWKVFLPGKQTQLSKYYMDILSEFLNSLGDIRRIRIINSIAERYFLFLSSNGHLTIGTVSTIDIRQFIVEASSFRPKSMDDVVTTLKKIQMIVFKTSLGFARHTYEGFLNDFSRFCLLHYPQESSLTKELALSWGMKRPTETPSGFRRRLCALREFGKYLNAIGIDSYVIPSDFTTGGTSFMPYIFSDRELSAIFAGADSLTTNKRTPI